MSNIDNGSVVDIDPRGKGSAKPIGCVSLIHFSGNTFYAIRDYKGRGVILPGGSREGNETYKQCAARELKEETGLRCTKQRYLLGMPDGTSYCVCFLTEIDAHDCSLFDKVCSAQGDVLVAATWADLLRSKYRHYYECLKDVYEGRYR